jgi:D-glycero-alpha-D-manno-heptose-7-phosphate kinase
VSLPVIRARAPLRLSFGGGGTDVPPFVTEHGGAVVNATNARYAYVTLAPNGTRQIRLRSLDLDDDVAYSLDDPAPPPAFGMDLARGVVQRLGVEARGHGFDLFTHTDCPPGSGLGASSTMTVALVGAFDRWLGLGLTRYEIAQLAHDIERDDLGIHGGRQDHYAAAFGGFNFIEFERERTLVNPLRVPAEWISELEYSLVLAYTGRSRLSASIIEDQMRNAATGQADAVAAMVETRRLADEMKRLLLTGQFRAFGETLHEAWLVKKRMSGKISTDQIDGLYEAARAAGALGGKIAGAGGGGFMFFFTGFDRRHAVEAALTAAGAEVVHFGFSEAGLQTWTR